MQDREDESTVRSHRVADDVEGEVEVVDVGQTEAADDGIERSVAQWCGCDVGVVVADAELLVVLGGDGLLDQCFGQIEALDGGAAAGQLAADATMAAGRVEQVLPGHRAEQLEQCGGYRVGVGVRPAGLVRSLRRRRTWRWPRCGRYDVERTGRRTVRIGRVVIGSAASGSSSGRRPAAAF